MRSRYDCGALGKAGSCCDTHRACCRYHPDKAAAEYERALGEHGVVAASTCDWGACVREQCTVLFNLINEAHEQLSDQHKRRKVRGAALLLWPYFVLLQTDYCKCHPKLLPLSTGGGE